MSHGATAASSRMSSEDSTRDAHVLEGGRGVEPSHSSSMNPNPAMAQYHAVVRSSIDASTKNGLVAVEVQKRCGTLSEQSASLHDDVLPNIVEAMKLHTAIDEILDKEINPTVSSVVGLLQAVEAEATQVGIARKRNAMLRNVAKQAKELAAANQQQQ